MTCQALVIEDNEILRSLLVEILGFSGFEVAAARNAAEAQRALETCLPALMFLDVNIPGGSGLQIVEQTRASRGGEAVTIVLTTGNTEVHQLPQAALANVILIKPFHVDEIEALAQRFLRSVIDTEQDGNAIRQVVKDYSDSTHRGANTTVG